MSFTQIIALILGAMLAENIVLNGALGLDLFIAGSKSRRSVLSLGAIFTAVAVVASFIGNILETYVLNPYGLESLQLIAYTLVVAALSIGVSKFVSLKLPKMAKSLGIYLPLIGANTAVLALMFKAGGSEYSIAMSLLVGLGAGIGFLVVTLIFSSLRERLEFTDSPKAFRGLPALMITSALLYLAFMGFIGLRF